MRSGARPWSEFSTCQEVAEPMFSGQCILIIDSRPFDQCTCAFEEDAGSARPCGFLSAPPALLEKALAASRVQLQFGEQDPRDIAMVAANAGLALFALTGTPPIRVMLSRGRWAAVVEGNNVRDVCMRAEEQLLQSGLAGEPVECQVFEADTGTTAAIVEYLASIQMAEATLEGAAVTPSVTCALELAKIERTIHRGEELVSILCRCIETLRQHGCEDELSTRLLDNMNDSLRLLARHRDMVRHGWYTFAR
jgi:hypothetical protein